MNNPEDAESSNAALRVEQLAMAAEESGVAYYAAYGLQPPNTRAPKPKREQVKNACTNCQRLCKKCDQDRPCKRCVSSNQRDTCVSSERKKRAIGLKRGPYKHKPVHYDEDGNEIGREGISAAPLGLEDGTQNSGSYQDAPFLPVYGFSEQGLPLGPDGQPIQLGTLYPTPIGGYTLPLATSLEQHQQEIAAMQRGNDLPGHSEQESLHSQPSLRSRDTGALGVDDLLSKMKRGEYAPLPGTEHLQPNDDSSLSPLSASPAELQFTPENDTTLTDTTQPSPESATYGGISAAAVANAFHVISPSPPSLLILEPGMALQQSRKRKASIEGLGRVRSSKR